MDDVVKSARSIVPGGPRQVTAVTSVAQTVVPAIAGPSASTVGAASISAPALFARPESGNGEMGAAAFPLVASASAAGTGTARVVTAAGGAAGTGAAGREGAGFTVEVVVQVVGKIVVDGKGVVDAGGHQAAQRIHVAADANPQRPAGKAARATKVEVEGWP